MSVKKSNILGISIHSIHKRGGIIFSFVHKAIRKFEVNVDVQKGALSFTKIMKTNVLGSSNLGFYPLLSYGNGPQWLSCPLLLGFAFEF